MLSAQRSRHRIPIALVASCLVGATLPGVFCPIVCLTHEASTLYEPHGGQMTAMPPCHAGNGVSAAQPRANLTLPALPASGRLVLDGGARPVAVVEPAAGAHSVLSEPPNPPPRLG